MLMAFFFQDLTVFVMSELPVSQVDLVEEPHEVHKINRQNFIDEQEWYLYKVTWQNITYLNLMLK